MHFENIRVVVVVVKISLVLEVTYPKSEIENYVRSKS